MVLICLMIADLEVDTFVSTISEIGYPSYICGDFNINLLKIHTKTHYNTFFENLLSSGFFSKNYIAYSYL